MLFNRRLHAGICSGEITCTVRIWQRCRVRIGGRYRVAGGHVEVDSIQAIELRDITGELARRSGFKGVIDLLKVARHGTGENVYLITFHYCAPARDGKGGTSRSLKAAARREGQIISRDR